MHRDRLGGDLAEHQNQQGHDPGGVADRQRFGEAVAAGELQHDLGDQGGGGDVDEVVADEQGGDEAGGVLLQKGERARGVVSVLAELTDLPAADSGQRGLRARHQPREQEQTDQQQELAEAHPPGTLGRLGYHGEQEGKG